MMKLNEYIKVFYLEVTIFFPFIYTRSESPNKGIQVFLLSIE